MHRDFLIYFCEPSPALPPFPLATSRRPVCLPLLDVRPRVIKIRDSITENSQLLLNITMPPTTPGGGQGVRVVAALGGGPVSSSSSSSQRMRSWLLPLMSMDPEDRFTLVDSPDFIFADPDRCLVYCDLYQASANNKRTSTVHCTCVELNENIALVVLRPGEHCSRDRTGDSISFIYVTLLQLIPPTSNKLLQLSMDLCHLALFPTCEKTKKDVANTYGVDQNSFPSSCVQELGYIDPPLETGKVEEQAGPSSAAEVPYSGLGSTAAAVRLHGGDVSSRVLISRK